MLITHDFLNRFTRCQRASLCMALFYLAVAVNGIYYKEQYVKTTVFVMISFLPLDLKDVSWIGTVICFKYDFGYVIVHRLQIMDIEVINAVLISDCLGSPFEPDCSSSGLDLYISVQEIKEPFKTNQPSWSWNWKRYFLSNIIFYLHKYNFMAQLIFI